MKIETNNFSLQFDSIEAASDKVDFVLSDENFMKVIKGEEKFDLFLYDASMNDALLG